MVAKNNRGLKQGTRIENNTCCCDHCDRIFRGHSDKAVKLLVKLHYKKAHPKINLVVRDETECRRFRSESQQILRTIGI